MDFTDYYKLSDRFLTWEEGKAYCESLGGQLAVNGMKDFPLRQKISRALGITSAWIGLSDVDEEGIWKWLDGTSAERNVNWYNGEPNGGRGENCAHIWPASLNFRLNDAQCSWRGAAALCELAVP
jgi:hypothetical protein